MKIVKTITSSFREKNILNRTISGGSNPRLKWMLYISAAFVGCTVELALSCISEKGLMSPLLIRSGLYFQDNFGLMWKKYKRVANDNCFLEQSRQSLTAVLERLSACMVLQSLAAKEKSFKCLVRVQVCDTQYCLK